MCRSLFPWEKENDDYNLLNFYNLLFRYAM